MSEHDVDYDAGTTIWNGREYPACANCGHSEIVPMHTSGVPGVICECGCDSYVPLTQSLGERHHRNGHLLELRGCMWRCLLCRHVFDAAVDAELFWCGDDCTGKHPGEVCA